jgi:type I restriction enzyme, S subunit
MVNTITKSLDIWLTAYTRKSKGRGKSVENLSMYGIDKLRELILDLAIRGKLVPQDPIEGDAKLLLEKISMEKIRLINQEGLKTTAKEVIEIEEEYIKKPNGWNYCRLGNLAKFIDYRGRTPKKIESGIPLITAKNVRFGYISREPKEYISEGEYENWMTRGLPKINDILFTTEAPLGNAALVDIEEKFALAQRVICFQFHEPRIAFFLRIILISPTFQRQLIEKATGMTATGIKAAKLKEIPVLLPPLPEQYRIVAKVDELMALCDKLEELQSDNNKAHQILVETLLETLTNAGNSQELEESWQRISENFETLFTTEESIDSLKQKILQLAVMGKLVPQNPDDEPASELLKKIEQEKEKLIKEGKIKRQKPLPEISEDEKPFELPEKWEWCRLGEVTNYGILEKAEPNSVENDTWVLELEDVEKETSKLLQKIRFADRKFRSSKNRFTKGDIIYGKLRPYLDKVVIADEDGVCTTEMIPIKGYKTISPQYLRLVLKSPYFIFYANESTHGMNLPRIGTDKARLALFPFVNEEQQHFIVAKVEELFSICDQLKEKIQETEKIKVQLADAVIENINGST